MKNEKIRSTSDDQLEKEDVPETVKVNKVAERSVAAVEQAIEYPKWVEEILDLGLSEEAVALFSQMIDTRLEGVTNKDRKLVGSFLYAADPDFVINNNKIQDIVRLLCDGIDEMHGMLSQSNQPEKALEAYLNGVDVLSDIAINPRLRYAALMLSQFNLLAQEFENKTERGVSPFSLKASTGYTDRAFLMNFKDYLVVESVLTGDDFSGLEHDYWWTGRETDQPWEKVIMAIGNVREEYDQIIRGYRLEANSLESKIEALKEAISAYEDTL